MHSKANVDYVNCIKSRLLYILSMPRKSHKIGCHRRIVRKLRISLRRNRPHGVIHGDWLFSESNYPQKHKENVIVGERVNEVDYRGYFDFNGNWHWNKDINVHDHDVKALRVVIESMNECYNENNQPIYPEGK